MRELRRVMMAVLALALVTTAALAADDEPPPFKPREPDARSALSAALINVLFLPIRIPLTFLGAEISGLTGFLTAGDENAANDVFDLFDGTQVVTPRIVQGKDPFRVTGHD